MHGLGVDEKVDVLGAVMQGVQAPQSGDFVAAAMAPVEADLAGDEGGEEAQRERGVTSCGGVPGRDEAMGAQGDGRQRKVEQRPQGAGYSGSNTGGPAGPL